VPYGEFSERTEILATHKHPHFFGLSPEAEETKIRIIWMAKELEARQELRFYAFLSMCCIVLDWLRALGHGFCVLLVAGDSVFDCAVFCVTFLPETPITIIRTIILAATMLNPKQTFYHPLSLRPCKP
jgi:hypothetical protein